MSEIKNAGKKGYGLLYFFIFMVLFIALIIKIYFYNFAFIK